MRQHFIINGARVPRGDVRSSGVGTRILALDFRFLGAELQNGRIDGEKPMHVLGSGHNAAFVIGRNFVSADGHGAVCDLD